MELREPVLILQDAREDALVVAEKEEGAEAAASDCEAERAAAAVPGAHVEGGSRTVSRNLNRRESKRLQAQ